MVCHLGLLGKLGRVLAPDRGRASRKRACALQDRQGGAQIAPLARGGDNVGGRGGKLKEALLDLSPEVTLRSVVGGLEARILPKPAVDTRPVHSRGVGGPR